MSSVRSLAAFAPARALRALRGGGAICLGVGLIGCASTGDYVFPNGRSEQCFVPCRSQHSSCNSNCAYHGLQHNESALDTFIQVSCYLQCDHALDECARGCGGSKRGEAQPRQGSSTSRQRELSAQLRRMRWEEMPAAQKQELLKSCSVLYDQVSQKATAVEGKPRATCPPREQFVSACKELSHDVVRCLDSRVMETERARCKEKMGGENPDAAAGMNVVLAKCYPSPKATPASRPAASRPEAPPKRQETDRE